MSAGERALDDGRGTGLPTLVLAGLVGAEAVAAVDPSEPFVVACRARRLRPPSCEAMAGV